MKLNVQSGKQVSRQSSQTFTNCNRLNADGDRARQSVGEKMSPVANAKSLPFICRAMKWPKLVLVFPKIDSLRRRVGRVDVLDISVPKRTDLLTDGTTPKALSASLSYIKFLLQVRPICDTFF